MNSGVRQWLRSCKSRWPWFCIRRDVTNIDSPLYLGKLTMTKDESLSLRKRDTTSGACIVSPPSMRRIFPHCSICSGTKLLAFSQVAMPKRSWRWLAIKRIRCGVRAKFWQGGIKTHLSSNYARSRYQFVGAAERMYVLTFFDHLLSTSELVWIPKLKYITQIVGCFYLRQLRKL